MVKKPMDFFFGVDKVAAEYSIGRQRIHKKLRNEAKIPKFLYQIVIVTNCFLPN
jgi:hypothetical protein